LLRTHLVKTFHDLHVTARFPNPNSYPPILPQEALTDDTLVSTACLSPSGLMNSAS
jgi:hypothetical protein